MIPKIIWSIWLSDTPDEFPPLIAKCLQTHHIEGYEHRYITKDNCFKETRYIQECLEAKQWAKAADYLRVWYLNQYGGIYLDADAEVIEGKNFDQFLSQELFCGEEENGFVSNAIIGARAGHPTLADYVGKVERNFIGSGELVFQPGMYLWTELLRYSSGAYIYPPDFFLPFNHHLDRLKLTDNSVTIHHFSKSWVK